MAFGHWLARRRQRRVAPTIPASPVLFEDLEPRLLLNANIFNAPLSYALGGTAQKVVTGDFTGDGIQDVAVLIRETDSVTLFRGNGDGTLTTQGTWAVQWSTGDGGEFKDMEAAEIGGGAGLDLVVVGGGWTCTVMYNNGTGTNFSTQECFVGAANPLDVALGDLGDLSHDGSGSAVTDIAIANATSVEAYYRNASNSWVCYVAMTGPQAPITIANVNLLGVGPNQIVVRESGKLVAYDYDPAPAGTFTRHDLRDTSTTNPIPSFTLSGFVGGDLAGWGRTDLVAIGDGVTQLEWFQNDDNWNLLTYSKDLSTIGSAWPTQVHIGDFTNSGSNDILWVESGTGDVWVGLSRGAIYHPSGFEWDQQTGVALSNPGNPVAVADLNGDGAADLITAASPLRVYLSRTLLATPAAPTSIRATDGEYSDRVRVTWDAMPGAFRYQVWRADAATGPWTMLTEWAYDTAFDDWTTVAGQNYWYHLVAVNSIGVSPDSVADRGFAWVGAKPQGVPYTQAFAALPADTDGWEYYSDPQGRIQVVSGQLQMDDTTTDGVYSLNEAILHLNLAGRRGVVLTFDHESSGDEPDPMPGGAWAGHTNGDGVAFSADGVTWYTLTTLGDSFIGGAFNLDTAIQTAGISYTPYFRIKFQQYDNLPWGTDGRGFDNIRVTFEPISPPTKGFIHMLFEGLLYQSPSVAEVGYYYTQLEGGPLSRSGMIDTLLDGGRFALYVAPIERLYRFFLQKAPTRAGLNFWVNQFRSGVSLSAIARTFAHSDTFKQAWAAKPEYAAIQGDLYYGLSNEDFVRWLYKYVLFVDAPDPANVTFWTGWLAVGGPREVLMTAFTECSTVVTNMYDISRVDVMAVGLAEVGLGPFELLGYSLLVTPGHGFENLADMLQATNEHQRFAAKWALNRYGPVARLYYAYLQQDGTIAGLEFWANQYDSGVSLAAIAHVFANSTRFLSVHGDVYNTASNTDFVSWLYTSVLGYATPDPGWVGYWAWWLSSGGTRSQLMVAFSECALYKALSRSRVTVTMLVCMIQGRSPFAADYNTWVPFLDANNPLDYVIERMATA